MTRPRDHRSKLFLTHANQFFYPFALRHGSSSCNVKSSIKSLGAALSTANNSVHCSLAESFFTTKRILSSTSIPIPTAPTSITTIKLYLLQMSTHNKDARYLQTAQIARSWTSLQRNHANRLRRLKRAREHTSSHHSHRRLHTHRLRTKQQHQNQQQRRPPHRRRSIPLAALASPRAHGRKGSLQRQRHHVRHTPKRTWAMGGWESGVGSPGPRVAETRFTDFGDWETYCAP